MFDTLRQDLRFGLRLLRMNPVATLTAMVSLGLGIGANTAMFTIVNAALLRPLPVAAPGDLALVFSGDRDNPSGVSSYPSYVDYRDRNEVFGGLAAFAEIAVSLSAEQGPALVRGAIVSGNYFEVLGVQAARGRVLSPADDRTPGAHPVVVVSHELWMRELGGRADAVGGTLSVNGRVYTVVGVTPAGFRGTSVLDPAELFVPMMMQAAVRPPRGGFSGEMDADLLSRRGSGWLDLVGRLRPGMTFERARAGLVTLSSQMEQAHPELGRGFLVSLYPLARVDPRAWPLLRNAALLLMGVVGLVLLIATANVANLLLARAVARRREIALRLALGGSRGRLVRQLLTETLLLAVGGATLGLFAASWSLQLLLQAVPATGMFAFRLDLPIDWRVAAFTSAVTVATAMFAGLAPALQGSRPGLVDALRDADPAASAGRRLRLRGQRALVVAQLALSMMLLVAAGLFVKSLWRAQGLAPGFAVESIATAHLPIDLLRYTRVQGQQFYRDVVERAEALPGVEAASLVRVVPLSGSGRTTPLHVEGQPAPEASSGAGSARLPTVSTNVVGLRYFETMGIGLVSGRGFSAQDAGGAPPVVVVNESFAARHFPGEPAIGRRIALGGATAREWREIIGVVRNSTYRTLAEAPAPFVYLHVAQQHETGMTLLVRTRRDPSLLLGDLRRTLIALEPNLPVTSVQPLAALVASALYPARMGARLMAVFAGIAVLLAAVGLYGVAAFAVSRRTREMGIRSALGARQRDLVSLVLRESLTLVCTGLALGAIGAALLAQLVRGFLYGVSPADPAVLASVAILLAAVMLGATGLPARRASRTDPLAALRAE